MSAPDIDPCAWCGDDASEERAGTPLCESCCEKATDAGVVAIHALHAMVRPNGLDTGAGFFKGMQLGRRALKMAGRAVRS